jgi:hypothetical protein
MRYLEGGLRKPAKKKMNDHRNPYMLKFARNGFSSYIGHLDWIHIVQVALERANLPLVYTEGYSTKPKLKFSPPLPVGLCSDTELVLFFLAANVADSIIVNTFQDSMPVSMPLIGAKFLYPAPAKNPFHSINGAFYEMFFPMDLDDNSRRKILDLMGGNPDAVDLPSLISEQKGLVLKVTNSDEFLSGDDHIDYVARLEGGATFQPVKYAIAMKEYLNLPHLPQGRRLSFLNIHDDGARKLFDFNENV